MAEPALEGQPQHAPEQAVRLAQHKQGQAVEHGAVGDAQLGACVCLGVAKVAGRSVRLQ